MFKDEFVTKKANLEAQRIITRTIIKKARDLIEESQSDDEFLGNLKDLCLLNQMQDSHNKD